MTKEEAINVIKEHIDTYITCHGEEDTVAVSLDNVDVEAFDMAIKALKQEPKAEVLDKIRAEIEHIGGNDEKAFCKNLNESYKQGLKDALNVIDKYKAEGSEE